MNFEPGSGSVLGVTLAPGASSEPLVLRAGQRLLAEVLAADATTFRAVLSLAGRRLETQLPPGMPPLQPGQLVRVTVAEASAERLVLRIDSAPVAEPAPPAAAPPTGTVPAATAARAPAAGDAAPTARPGVAAFDPAAVLAQLDLPASPPLRAAVTALLEQGQPLQREVLLAIRSAIAGQPGLVEENARAAVLLRQAGIPLTARSLELARIALSTQTSLGPLLGELLRSLDDQLGSPNTAPTPARGAPASGDPESSAGQPAQSSAAVADPIPSSTPTRSASGPGSAGVPVRPGESPANPSLSPQAGNAAPPPPAGSAPGAGPLGSADPPAPPAPVQAHGGGITSPQATDLAGDPLTPAPVPTPAPASGAAPTLAMLHRSISQLAVRALEPDALAYAVDQLMRAPEAVLAQRLTAEAAAVADLPYAADAPAGARVTLRALVDGTPPDGTRSPAGTGESTALRPPAVGEAPAAPAPSLSVAVRLLAQALHDRIELQQLRTAAAQASTPQSPATPPAIEAPTPGPPGAPASPPALPLILSIPLAVAGQYTTLELHVQPDGQARREAGEPGTTAVRASFSVQLQRLGTVAADVRLAGATLRCRLRAASPEGVETLAAATAGLRARFEAAGFQVEALACERLDDPPAAPPPSLHHVSLRA